MVKEVERSRERQPGMATEGAQSPERQPGMATEGARSQAERQPGMANQAGPDGRRERQILEALPFPSHSGPCVKATPFAIPGNGSRNGKPSWPGQGKGLGAGDRGQGAEARADTDLGGDSSRCSGSLNRAQAIQAGAHELAWRGGGGGWGVRSAAIHHSS